MFRDSIGKALSWSVCSLFLSVAALRADAIGEPVTSESEPATVSSAPTHKQVRTIQPEVDGKSVGLNTFCLDRKGNLLCCVPTNAILVYSPEGVQKASIPLEFNPTAINVATDGTIYVAGAGKMAKLNADGQVLAVVGTPNIGDVEEFKQRAIEAAKKQAEEWTNQFDEQLKSFDERIAKIEAVPEEERTATQKARLKAFTRQRNDLKQQIEALKGQFGNVDPQQAMAEAATVSGIAVTDEEVFVCTRALEGYSYEIWKTDREFNGGERIMTDLSGCCGQMDIQAAGSQLFVAANTRFRVLVCDDNGKELSSFGKQDRTAVDGFGSCCNPMNLRCCENGDILAAESSIGNIKRFSAEGTFLGLVGKAKIGGGCKHVAIGYDPQRDYYYMMNVDRGHVCVLVPASQVPEFTEEELQAKQARDGLGQKLIGVWVHPDTKPAKKRPTGLTAVLSSLLGAGDSSSSLNFEQVTFSEDRKMQIIGGHMAEWGVTWSWEPVRQDGDVLIVSFLADGVQYFDYEIAFSGDNEMTASQLDAGATFAKEKYRRKGTSAPESEAAAVDSAEQPSTVKN